MPRNILEMDVNVKGYNDFVRNGNLRLGDTWEQLVEEGLLQRTVRRYRLSLVSTRLKSVSLDDTDVRAVYSGMARRSKCTHEGGAEAPQALPEPAEFAAYVEELAVHAKTAED